MSIWLSARKFSTFASNSLRVCVVGSGPSGFYTAEKVFGVYVYCRLIFGW